MFSVRSLLMVEKVLTKNDLAMQPASKASDIFIRLSMSMEDILKK